MLQFQLSVCLLTPELSQDQIQELFTLKYADSLFRLIREFKEYALQHTGFNSMEQLWLAFFMYDKYKQFWDGIKWTLVKNI